jgi:hypothetical protein
MLLSVISVSIFETNCIDLHSEVSHITKDLHHSSDNSGENQGHCSHFCMQCHFIAIEAQVFSHSAFTSFREIQYFVSTTQTRYIKQTLYRPPIA